MKSFTKFTLFAGAAIVLFFGAACTKKFDKLNTDPALVTKDIINPSFLFTAVLKNSIFSTYSGGIISEYAGYLSNIASGTILQDRNWSEPFRTQYRSYLINTAEIIRLTSGTPRLSNENAVARIWRVWLYHQLTDAYGDIPYTEALKNVAEVINQPKYDTQEAIYKDMLKELKEAAAQLNTDPSLASFGNADILFGGNVDKWKRFANSLRLRLAIRVRYADAALAQQHITEVITAPLIDANSLNAKLTTIDGDDVNNRNPFYNTIVVGGVDVFFISLTVTENLKNLSDPRLSVFALPASDGVSGYRGRPIALFGDEKLPYTTEKIARFPIYLKAAVYPIIIMNAAEVYFLRAEAALAGLSSENPQQMFIKGIQASLEQYNIAPAAITNYLNSASGTLAGTNEQKLEQIIIQKFLANYFEGYEGWAEFRRTGYPKIWTGSDKGSTNGAIPRRLTYPQDEYAKNESNVTEAVNRLNGGDKLLSRIWWDKKPGLPFPHPKQGLFPPGL